MTKLVYYLKDEIYKKIYVAESIGEQDFLYTLFCLYYRFKPSIGVIKENKLSELKYDVINVTDIFYKKYKEPKLCMLIFIRKFIPFYQKNIIYFNMLNKIWNDKYNEVLNKNKNTNEIFLLTVYLDTIFAFTITMKEEIKLL